MNTASDINPITEADVQAALAYVDQHWQDNGLSCKSAQLLKQYPTNGTELLTYLTENWLVEVSCGGVIWFTVKGTAYLHLKDVISLEDLNTHWKVK